MKLNEEKSKVIIFNFSRHYQFSTRLKMNTEYLEIVKDTKILGLIISDDLSWKKNTENLVKNGNKRLAILRSLVKFPIPIKDLVMLYCQFIRSILEFNSCVWYSSITEEECEDLDRVQKNACKLILKKEYTEYKSALTVLGLDCLRVRREKLALKFAKKCLELPTM